MAEEKRGDRDRVREEFFRLTAFDAESFHESKIASYVKRKLIQLGLTVEEDGAAAKIAQAHRNPAPSRRDNTDLLLLYKSQNEILTIITNCDIISYRLEPVYKSGKKWRTRKC